MRAAFDPSHAFDIVESTAEFGDGYSLSGVVCKPRLQSQENTALVILNSGRMHRVGTCRMSVKLARQAAEKGFLSLRFDESGIGDSAARVVEVSDDDRVLEEIRAALEYLRQSFGISRFVLFGLCSGAQYSFRYALNDTSVVGLAGIDNWVYTSSKYLLRHYSARIFRLRSWTGIIRKGIEKMAPRVSDPLWIWAAPPPRKFMEDGYRKLVGRGTRLNYTYTGSGSSHIYNYTRQMFDMYPGVDFKDLLSVSYLPNASHIVIEPLEQEKVICNIVTWLGR